MSRSAMSSPMSSRERQEEELDSIARATERAFERVRTARERAETRRRVKSMPNTPVVVSEFRRFESQWTPPRGDVGATRLVFDAAEDETRTAPASSEDAPRDVAEASGNEAIDALVDEAAAKCRKLDIVEVDEEEAEENPEEGVEKEARAFIAEPSVIAREEVVVPSKETKPMKVDKRAVRELALKNPELAKAPSYYRNSLQSSSASTLETQTSMSPRKSEEPTTEESCVVM